MMGNDRGSCGSGYGASAGGGTEMSLFNAFIDDLCILCLMSLSMIYV